MLACAVYCSVQSDQSIAAVSDEFGERKVITKTIRDSFSHIGVLDCQLTAPLIYVFIQCFSQLVFFVASELFLLVCWFKFASASVAVWQSFMLCCSLLLPAPLFFPLSLLINSVDHFPAILCSVA